VADILPSKITAGLTLELSVTLTAYPAPEWGLTVLLRGPQSHDLQAVADGAQHRISVDAPTTASWTPGEYWYSVRATNGGTVHQVEEGTITVRPDLASASAGYDGRGHAEKVLAAIEAVLENRASQDQQSYTINNRSLQRTPIGDLLKLRSFYRAEVARLKAAGKGNGLLGRLARVRF
jgi:hypothetical protein